MDYRRIYDDFIKSRQNRQFLLEKEYENHHILPKSKGGLDHPSNMIYLTIREHCFAHLLLYKIYNDKISFWSFQWFFDYMSPSAMKIWKNNRSKYNNNKSFTQTQNFRDKQQEINCFLWSKDDYKEKHITIRNTKKYKEKQKENTTNLWKRRERNTQDKKTGRFPSKQISVDGIIYPSYTAASIKYNIDNKTVKHRGKSKYFPNWVLLD